MNEHIRFTATALIISLAALPACRRDMGAREGVAELRDADGGVVGVAILQEVDDGVRINFSGTNLPPGPRGFHIHETGECTPPTFESAGEHFNPTDAGHGLADPEGPHVGDLPNLVVAADGTVEVTVVASGATLADTGELSLVAGDGTALVIHAEADDQITDPAGGAGDRIACGVIRRR
jgi:superoxide dismutase, Cu-Zn family